MNVHVQPNPQVRPIEIAREAFWSFRHPLNQAFQRERATTCFSLRELIAYAEEIPAEILHDYAGGAVAAFAEVEG